MTEEKNNNVISLSFVVDNQKPPYKQSPASASERDNQERYSEVLKEKAKEVFNGPILITECSISIRYCRCEGMMDGANIIGGILDTLQGIIFKDDKQITKISYVEWRGELDWYQVIITELY